MIRFIKNYERKKNEAINLKKKKGRYDHITPF